MSVVLMNTVALDDGIIIKKGSGSGGGTPKPALAVNDATFYDYDGTILHSYTKDEFLALKEMPALPTQEGLVCQEWNWDFEDAKAYVDKYGTIDVGATYVTDDGKTRFYITIVAEGRMQVPLALTQSVANGVVVDWGDGGATETFASTSATVLRHTYSEIGDYVITFEVLDGTLSFFGSSSYGVFASTIYAYGNMLQKVEIGNNVTVIGQYAFNNCYSLASIVIPNGVTGIGQYAFNNCNSLVSIVIPNGVTRLANNIFFYCRALASIVIPNGVTSIGNSTLNGCYSLASIVIPNGVTGIGQYAFNNCNSLVSIVIPNGVTSIMDSAFYGCSSLVSIVIPNSVTSIGNSTFYRCSSVAFCDFRTHASVPTLSNKNAFSNIASDCKIVVPDELYDTWIAATNWSSVASYIIKASQYNG